MGGSELTVLVVDDDFRVGNMHAGIVNALPGFTVTATATTLAAARKVDPVDLALVDVYLPDGSGVDFVRSGGKLPSRPGRIHEAIVKQ